MEQEKEITTKQTHTSGIWIPVSVLLAGISLIACTLIFTQGFFRYKRSGTNAGITATGSASCDFESDLIVWRGGFSAFGATTDVAYGTIKHDAEMVQNYLTENGISDDEIVFSSVNISKHYNSIYNDEGNYVGDELSGYDLSQNVCITSNDVDKVEKISRDITGLIESGVEFTSEPPEYYYTKLDELKLQLIEDATKNAKDRIDIIAAGTNSHPGRLTSANLGVFQITAQNSASEEYSYGGTFNTSSRNKTATITVKLNYETD